MRFNEVIGTETKKPYSFHHHFVNSEIKESINDNLKTFIKKMFLDQGSPLCSTLRKKVDDIGIELERLKKLLTLINNDQLPLLMEKYKNESKKIGRELKMSGTIKFFCGAVAVISGGFLINYVVKKGEKGIKQR